MMRRLSLITLALALATAPPALAGRFKRLDAPPAAPKDSLRLKLEPAPAPVEAPPAQAALPPGSPRPAGVFFRSLLVPGWGHAVLARSRPELAGKGKAGFWLDVGLLTGAWALYHLSQTKEAEYQAYAVRVAGARPHSDGSDYWVDVSNHLSRAEYNRSMLESGGYNRRYLDPADDWVWPSRAEQIRYRDLRTVSDKAASQSLAVGGALLLNHVLSATQALKLARNVPAGARIEAATLDDAPALTLVLPVGGRR